jgi:hypothetical protein
MVMIVVCDAVSSGRSSLILRRNILTPFSGSKCKLIKSQR